jgi:hypothetical protein
MRLCATLALCLLVACGGSGGGGGTPPLGGGTPPATWTKRAEGGDKITAVARSGNTFVALTEDDPAKRILSSTDGHTWSHPAYTGSPSYVDIVFGNNLFVAIGNSVASSPDGVAWTTRLNWVEVPLFSVAWSGSAFVAVGAFGAVRRSSDGLTWTPPTTEPVLSPGSNLNSVAGNGSTFVAAGGDKTTLKGAIFYSTDAGITWTAATLPLVFDDFAFDKVVWDGSRFLATSHFLSHGRGSGGTWSSADGITWTNVSGTYGGHLTPTPGASTAYVGTNGVGWMRTSSDGVTWTDGYNFVHERLTDVLWMQDRGEYLVTASKLDARGFIATSTDGVTWHARYTSGQRTAALWDGSRFVSIDRQGRVFTSPDGIAWASSVIISTPISGPYHDIVWSGSRYVVVGLDQIVTSTDASTWSAAALINMREFVAATWNGSEFAAISRNREIYRSTTGTSWPQTGTPIGTTGSLTDLAWGGAPVNRYVAVGTAGSAYFSADGTAWTTRNAATMSNLHSVVWTGTQFVAVGGAGTVVTSPDGDTWTNRSIASGPTFNAVAFIDNQLIAVGGARIFVSADGVSWSEETSGTAHTLFAVAGTAAQKVAMGAKGVIVSRP